jgi:hypothetical protein
MARGIQVYIEPRYVDTCSVVWDNDCESPANLDPPERVRCECYACGLPVCKACSRRITYHGSRRRVCRNCIEGMGA